MNFMKATKVNYDPHHIISQRRQQNKNKPFEHQEVHGLANRDNLMYYQSDVNNLGSLQENPFAIVKKTTMIVPTPSKIEVTGKRSHLEIMEVEEQGSETSKR